MHEFTTIEAIRKLFPASPAQTNDPFTCDAEIVELSGALYGITMDEFSAAEDFFPDADPVALGRDLAAATLSDLLAAGCEPCFYLQAVTAPYGRANFAEELCRGVADVLQSCNCFLLGGDMGQSDNWRYTGVAIGLCRHGKPLTRILPDRPQKLWLTGALGGGNLRALGLPAPQFVSRHIEARDIHAVATACIDTSGGLMDAVSMLSRVNPAHDFHIDAWALPYDAAVCRVAPEHNLPLEAFAFGAAGEYELLFTTDTGVDLDWAANIGTAEPDSPGRIYWDAKALAQLPPDARSFADVADYVSALKEYLTCLS